MYPGQNDQFGGPPGGEGGMGFGPTNGGFGGPPPADAMFESFFDDGLDDLVDTEAVREARESEVFATGIHFFNHMRAMGK